MKRMFIPAALAGLLALAGWSKEAAAPASSAEKATPSPLEDKLDHLILPKVPDVASVSWEEAMEYLRVKTRQVDTGTPFLKGVNFVVVGGGETKQATTPSPQLINVSVREALRHVTEHWGMKYRVDSHAVVITAKDGKPPEPPLTESDAPTEREKRALHSLSRRIFPTVSWQNCTVEEAVEYLRVSYGCDPFGPTLLTNTVLHLRDNTQRPPLTLDLRDIPKSEVMRYIAEMSGLKMSLRSSALVLSDYELGPPPKAPVKPSRMETRASQMILRSVAFQGTTLTEAVEFLRAKSREIDPAHQDISIVVRPGGGDDPVITLDLLDVPLIDVLDHITLQSRHRVSVEGASFVLTPVKATDP